MAVAFVKAATGDGFGGAPCTAVFGSNVTSGNAIAIWIAWYQVAITLDSVTDTRGTTYTLYDNPTSVDVAGRAAWAVGVLGSTGANTITANFSLSPVYFSICAHEVSGTDATPVDQHAINAQTAPGTGTDGCTSGNVTTTTDGQYIMGGCSDAALNGVPTSAGTGFTSRSTTSYNRSEDLIQSSAGSIAATFTLSSFGSDPHLTGIMTLKAAGGASSVAPNIIRAAQRVIPPTAYRIMKRRMPRLTDIFLNLAHGTN